jgi:hypothetical protein
MGCGRVLNMFQGQCAPLALWIEVGEMHIYCCNVSTEKDLGEIFTITDRSTKIYNMKLSGTGKGSDVKLE